MREQDRHIPYSERLESLKQTLNSEIVAIHREFGVRKAMERVRDEVWRDGELFWTSYSDKELDGELTPRSFDDLPIGFALQAYIPMIIATYSRPVVGQRWSEGVECRPRVIRGRGYHLVYGDYEIRRARVEDSWIQMDIIARPIWEDGHFPMISFDKKSPIGYELVVNDYRLPARGKVRSAKDLLSKRYPEDEVYHDLGGKYVFWPRDREVMVGVRRGVTTVINVGDQDAKQQFEEAIEQTTEGRISARGLPHQMREEAQKLIAKMPQEFQKVRQGTKADFEMWLRINKPMWRRIVGRAS